MTVGREAGATYVLGYGFVANPALVLCVAEGVGVGVGFETGCGGGGVGATAGLGGGATGCDVGAQLATRAPAADVSTVRHAEESQDIGGRIARGIVSPGD
jgi:hypothetical protein